MLHVRPSSGLLRDPETPIKCYFTVKYVTNGNSILLPFAYYKTMFGTIDVKTRPIRIAYLVDPSDPSQVREAIGLSSTLWGGSCFPIVPLYEQMPATWKDGPLEAPPSMSVILGYLEAFDPDILVQFSKEVPAYITTLAIRIIKPEDVWQTLDEGRHFSPKFGIGIFELLGDIFKEHFKYKPKYPVKVVLPTIPEDLALFWASMFGEIPTKLIPILKQHYFEPLEIQVKEFQLDKLLETVAGDVLFPRRISQQRLNHQNRSGFRRDAYVYYLDATKTDDIVDFWNLRAMGKQVVPVPKQLKDDPQLLELVIKFLKAHRRPWSHNPSVCNYASFIRARNCTMEEMQEFAKTLTIDPIPDDPSSSPFFALQHWYPKVWDEWARNKDGAVPDEIYGDEEDSIEIGDTKELKFRIKPLLPKFAQKHVYHGEPRCANEVRFRFYGSEEPLAEVFPKNSGSNLERAISGLTSFPGDWRIDRNGLVKLVKNDFSETRNIPTAEGIIFAYLTDLGWTPKLSAPGILTKHIFRIFEGFSGIFRDEKLLGLLEHMNGGKVREDMTPIATEENERAHSFYQERDLTVGQVKSRLAQLSKHADFHANLASKQVFKLGLRLQCPSCTRNSWFSLKDIDDSFICPKCHIPFSAVGNIDHGQWSYKTSGPFSVPKFADGAYAVLLTLDLLSDQKMPTMRTTPVFSFEAKGPNGKKLEADLGVLWEEAIFGERRDGVLFAECKTYNTFEERDFDRMRELFEAFPGSILAFSTLRTSLTDKEVLGLTSIATSGRTHWKTERPLNPVLILTGNELLNWQGPPYCWDEATKQRFSHRDGVINLCDATQQIYLGLNSWHDDWRREWARQRTDTERPQ